MGVGNTGGFTPKSYHGPGSGHSKQAKGNPIGTGSKSTKAPVANIKEGSVMGDRTKGEVAHTGPADRGSHLVEKCGMGHETATGVHGIGVSSAPRMKFGAPHSFKTRGNPLRNSGVAGAHRVGKR